MNNPVIYQRNTATGNFENPDNFAPARQASKCEIKWIDTFGQPTPDANEAVGRVMLKARVQQIGGHGVSFSASPWYNICACHAERLAGPGMEGWVFEAIIDRGVVWC